MIGRMRKPACVGEDLKDVCTHPELCSLCSLWQQPGETREQWRARLRALARADITADREQGAA